MEEAKLPELWQKELTVLKKLIIFDSNGNLLKEKDVSGVWQEASEKLGKEAHTVYIDVQQNRHNLKTLLRKHFKFYEPGEELYDYEIPESDDDSDSEAQCESEKNSSDSEYVPSKFTNFADFKPLDFRIDLNAKEWADIRPISVRYADGRDYLVLQSDWTDIIVKKVAKATPVKCSFSFKKHQFYADQDYPFFDFYGNCHECNNYIEGSCSREFSIDSETISINICTFDRSEYSHEGKRKLKNSNRRMAGAKLKYVKASVYRQEAANDSLEYSDLEPAYFNNSGVLRKLRQEEIDRALGLTGPSAVFQSILHLSENAFPEIREVNKNPFIVKYITDEQIQLWKDLKAKQRLCVSIDASGGFSKRVSDSGYIFLYAMVTGYGNKTAQLWQMLSEKHDTNIIFFGLSLPISLGAPIPDEASTDGAFAMLNGACLCFNKCSYMQFNSICLKKLNGEDVKLKPCWIRMDRAHIMKTPSRWKCLANKAFEIKDFYERIIGYATQIEDFKILKEVLLSVFIVALSSYCTPNSECWQRKVWLKDKIKTFDSKCFENERVSDSMHNVTYQDIDTSEESQKDELSSNAVKDFVMSTYNEAEKLLDKGTGVTAVINSLVCPAIKDNIIYLFVQFPAWTNCMKKYYNSTADAGNSARSEELFKDEKNNHYIHYPISANRFILSNLISINGRVRLLKAAIKNSELEKCKQIHDKEIEKRSTKVVRKKKTNDSYKTSVSCSSSQSKDLPLAKVFQKNHQVTENIQYIKETAAFELNKNQEVVISNGGLLNTAFLCDDKWIYFYNTCAYDSLSEILICATDLNSVKGFIDADPSCEYLKSISKYVNNGLIDLYYEDRATILYPIMTEDTFDSDIIDCQINVNELAKEVFKDNKNYLVKSTKRCDECKYVKEKFFNTMMLPFREVPKIIGKPNGMENLQECFNDIINNPYVDQCPKCFKVSRKLSYEVRDLIFLETEFIFTSQEIHHTINSKCPQLVIVNDREYRLIGVVELEKRPKAVNHYKAYCRFNEIWLLKDDTKDSVQVMHELPIDIKISMVVYAKSNE